MIGGFEELLYGMIKHFFGVLLYMLPFSGFSGWCPGVLPVKKASNSSSTSCMLSFNTPADQTWVVSNILEEWHKECTEEWIFGDVEKEQRVKEECLRVLGLFFLLDFYIIVFLHHSFEILDTTQHTNNQKSKE